MKYKNKYNTRTWLIQMLKNLLKTSTTEQKKKIKYEIGKLNAITNK